MTPAPSIFEITVSDEKAGPYGITAGPDGALWATLVHSGGSRASPSTERCGTSPGLAGLRADGHHHRPRRRAVVHALPGPSGRPDHARRENADLSVPTPDSGPFGITAGPDGAMWFTETAADRIGRVTSEGAFTEFTLPTERRVPLRDHRGTRRGSVVHPQPGERDRSHHDRRRRSPVHPLPTAGAAPVGITSDGEDLWFVEIGAGQVGRMSTGGEIEEFPLPDRTARPTPSPQRRSATAGSPSGVPTASARHPDRRDHRVRPAVTGIRTARHHRRSRRSALGGPGGGRGGEGGPVAPRARGTDRPLAESAGTGVGRSGSTTRCSHRSLCLLRGAASAAEVLGEVPFDRAVGLDPVLGVLEAVAFVVGDEVLDRDASFAQRGDDVVGLGTDDPDVVGALGDEQRGCGSGRPW